MRLNFEWRCFHTLNKICQLHVFLHQPFLYRFDFGIPRRLGSRVVCLTFLPSCLVLPSGWLRCAVISPLLVVSVLPSSRCMLGTACRQHCVASSNSHSSDSRCCRIHLGCEISHIYSTSTDIPIIRIQVTVTLAFLASRCNGNLELYLVWEPVNVDEFRERHFFRVCNGQSFATMFFPVS